MSARSGTALLALLLMTASSNAWAQRRSPTAPAVEDWRHGTTLTGSLGAVSDSTDTGVAAGGAVGWELSPRLSLEGGGFWMDRGYGSDGFNASLKMRAGVRRGAVAPFVEGGVGLFHISVNTAQPMPEFYRRRLETGGASLRQSFTDPTFQIGGGATLFLSRHIAIQPAVEAIIVTRDSQTHTMAAVALRIAYHFEDHPVTR